MNKQGSETQDLSLFTCQQVVELKPNSVLATRLLLQPVPKVPDHWDTFGGGCVCVRLWGGVSPRGYHFLTSKVQDPHPLDRYMNANRPLSRGGTGKALTYLSGQV